MTRQRGDVPKYGLASGNSRSPRIRICPKCGAKPTINKSIEKRFGKLYCSHCNIMYLPKKKAKKA